MAIANSNSLKGQSSSKTKHENNLGAYHLYELRPVVMNKITISEIRACSHFFYIYKNFPVPSNRSGLQRFCWLIPLQSTQSLGYHRHPWEAHHRHSTEAAEKASRWLCLKRSKPRSSATQTQVGVWSPSPGRPSCSGPKNPVIQVNITDDMSECLFWGGRWRPGGARRSQVMAQQAWPSWDLSGG